MDKTADAKMKFKVIFAEGAMKAERSMKADELGSVKRLLDWESLEGMELDVLGAPFGGHLMGRDAYGEAFHPGTNIWLTEGELVPVTYYHGFGPDDPYEWQDDPKVIGMAKLSGAVENEGFWFRVKLDEQEELGLRISAAMQAGKEVRASSGAVGHLVRYGQAGLIDVWPVGELAIFDTNEWRKPANELAVVEKARTTINTNKNSDKNSDEETTTMNEPDLNLRTEAGLEAVGETVKSAAAPGEEAVQRDGQTNLVRADGPMEETMDQEERDALIKGVVEAMSPMIDDKLDARIKAETGGLATNIQVTKDAGDQPWEKPGDFFKAVKTAALYPNRVDVRLKATGMSEGVPADGGYLVPTSMSGQILDRMYSTGEILSRIAMDSVSGNAMLYNGIDETTHVGSLYGGVIGYWTAEGGTITASKPKFYQIALKLKKIAALCYATDEQLEDTAALESWLVRTVPDVLRWYVESAIISGDGVGKPLGITQSPCLISPVREDANEVNPSDFAAMWSRRWTGASDYVWLVNPTVTAWMNMFSVGTFPVYMPQGSMVGKPYGTLYGAPVIESEHIAAAKSAGDVLLCSLSQYQAISKGGVKSDSSIHVSFATDETAFRFVYRIDGQPVWHSALTPENGSTISPFVSLAAASS